MVDVKIGNLTFNGVDSVKLNTTDGGEVVFTLEGSGGNSSGTTVNPDKSGVIVTDLDACYGTTEVFSFFKLADEPFRTDPNTPIPLQRIKSANYAINPFFDFPSRAEYLESKSRIQNPYNFDECEWGFAEDNMEYYDGLESAYVSGADDGNYFVRVTADEASAFGTVVLLPKGLYAVRQSDYYPASIEILPPTE